MSSILMTEDVKQKWEPVLEHESFNKIDSQYRKYVTTVLLENQSKFLAEASAPNTSMGNGNMATWDPVLISMVRRTTPNLLAFDVAGVQPMNMPTGLIFAMRARYDNNSGTEAFYNEANTRHTGAPSTYSMADTSGFTQAALATGLAVSASGGYTLTVADDASLVAGNTLVSGSLVASITDVGALVAGERVVTVNRPVTGAGSTASIWDTDYILGVGMSTSELEKLGSTGNLGIDWAKMSFSIEKFSVEAKGRAIKADYSTELATDLKNVHGLNAESELANILSTEMQAEQNREMIRRINYSAKLANGGNAINVASNTADGRWFIERVKAVLLYMDFQANQIAKETRRGKATFALMSSNVAAMLSVAGVLDHAPAMQTQLNVDDTGNLFAGVLMGKYKV